jgi:hypothetical protein
VRDIYNSVNEELLKNRDRKYTVVEIIFFKRWWQEASAKSRAKFVSLVKSKQIQLSNFGWVSNDEACVDYRDAIDQQGLGTASLLEIFGTDDSGRELIKSMFESNNETSLVGWQIDPFGHSRFQAYLYRKMGMDGKKMMQAKILFFFSGWFLGRTDSQDFASRRARHSMEYFSDTSINPYNNYDNDAKNSSIASSGFIAVEKVKFCVSNDGGSPTTCPATSAPTLVESSVKGNIDYLFPTVTLSKYSPPEPEFQYDQYPHYGTSVGGIYQDAEYYDSNVTKTIPTTKKFATSVTETSSSSSLSSSSPSKNIFSGNEAADDNNMDSRNKQDSFQNLKTLQMAVEAASADVSR